MTRVTFRQRYRCILAWSCLTGLPYSSGMMKRSSSPHDAAFFGAFAESESTYNEDADPGANGLPTAWEQQPGRSGNAARFHESSSAGPSQAWQTHFPALQTGLAGHGVATGAWSVTGDGHWHQAYSPAVRAGKANKILGPNIGEWFDSSVNQFDGFGRPRPPDLHSAKRLLSWTERAVNTTLSCSEVGCTANTLLQAFDGAHEEARNCKLSLYLHPTDFDDQYSGERLEWVRINDQVVSTDCFPMISGCNATSQVPLYPCLQDLSLDTIVDSAGALRISAKISDTVDECRYEGNLLAAVPMVTCLIAPHRREILGAQPKLPDLSPRRKPPPPPLPPPPLDIVVSAPLRCSERGCSATTHLLPPAGEWSRLRKVQTKCVMNVTLFQTDFDATDGSELLEYFKVNGVTRSSNVAPGRNPCHSVWQGSPLLADEVKFPLLIGEDVTESFAAGNLSVGAKISLHVDECAYEGHLLSGLLEVRCLETAPLVKPQ